MTVTPPSGHRVNNCDMICMSCNLIHMTLKSQSALHDGCWWPGGIWHQGICNHHADVSESVYIRIVPMQWWWNAKRILQALLAKNSSQFLLFVSRCFGSHNALLQFKLALRTLNLIMKICMVVANVLVLNRYQAISKTQCQENYPWYHITQHIDGLVQDCSNSIANALESLQSYTKPSICDTKQPVGNNGWQPEMSLWMVHNMLIVYHYVLWHLHAWWRKYLGLIHVPYQHLKVENKGVISQFPPGKVNLSS